MPLRGIASTVVVAAALLAVAVTVVATPANTLSLVKVPGSKCLDGSTAGFYFESGTPGTTLWVIYLQGGGVCTNEVTCQQRAQTALGSSKYWSNTVTGSGFYAADATVNPGFFHANKVFVPYCTGDVHSGQVTEPSARSLGFAFAGHSNLELIVDYLWANSTGPMRDADMLLLTGSSAGGFGTFLNADWLSAKLPHVSMKAVPQAGWFFPGDAGAPNPAWQPPIPFPLWAVGQPFDPVAYHNLTMLWDMYLHPKCMAAQVGGQVFHCFSVHVLYPFIATPLFVLENQFDSNQIFVELKTPTNATDPTVRKYIAYFGAAMLNSTAQIAASATKKDGLFLPSCLLHTMSASIAVGGSTFMTPVVNWYYDTESSGSSSSRILVDNCGALPCNPACKLK